MFDKFQRRVRRLRHLRPSRGREPHLPRPVRAAASRAGERGHRRVRRRADPRIEGDGLRQRGLRRRHAGEAARARWPSATSAIRRPARAASPTRSRSSSTACTASSRSATTATSSTPARCATRSSARAPSSRPAATPRSSSTCSRVAGRGRRGGDHRRDLAGARRVLVRDDDEGSRSSACAIRTASGRWPSAGSATRGSSAPRPARWI